MCQHQEAPGVHSLLCHTLWLLDQSMSKCWWQERRALTCSTVVAGHVTHMMWALMTLRHTWGVARADPDTLALRHGRHNWRRNWHQSPMRLDTIGTMGPHFGLKRRWGSGVTQLVFWLASWYLDTLRRQRVGFGGRWAPPADQRRVFVTVDRLAQCESQQHS